MGIYISENDFQSKEIDQIPRSPIVFKLRVQSTIMCGLLLLFVTLTLTAGGASPLETQHAIIGPYQLLLNFYSLPRAGQALSMTVEPASAGVTLQFSRVALKPAPGTDAKTILVNLTPDSETKGVYDVNVTPSIRGKWLLHLQVVGISGTAVGDIPINVEGPPEIPTWLGWLIGLTPLPLLIGFILLQVRWRRTQRKRILQEMTEHTFV